MMSFALVTLVWCDWYGWQTLGTDVAAYATVGVGAATENPYVAAGGVGLWLLGPPAIHLSHGEKERAALSLGGRVVLPLASGWIADLLVKDSGCCCDHTCKDGFEAVLGGFCGVLAASVLDAVIAWDSDDDEPDAVILTIGGDF